MTTTRYDRIGRSYTQTRRTEPRIQARIDAALGNARRVVNVGAGTGSYEPVGRDVVAVEPSPTMIGQRAPGAAPVVRAYAEALPFPKGTFDAALAVFTAHHWTDPERGLRELARVAKRQVVLSFEEAADERFWLIADYFREVAPLDDDRGYTPEAIGRALDMRRVEQVPVPADCVDGFMACYWNRPEAYLDPAVQAGISGLARLDPSDREGMTAKLRADLESGAWDAKHGHLRTLSELDVGYVLIVSGD